MSSTSAAYPGHGTCLLAAAQFPRACRHRRANQNDCQDSISDRGERRAERPGNGRRNHEAGSSSLQEVSEGFCRVFPVNTRFERLGKHLLRAATADLCAPGADPDGPLSRHKDEKKRYHRRRVSGDLPLANSELLGRLMPCKAAFNATISST